MRKLALTLAATVAALGVGLAVAPAAQAAPVSGGAAIAVSCPRPAHSVNGEGAATMKINGNLKDGAASACGNVQYLNQGTLMYLWCYYYNTSTQHTWYYVRVAGGSTYGWMSADNFNWDYNHWDDNHDGNLEDTKECR